MRGGTMPGGRTTVTGETGRARDVVVVAMEAWRRALAVDAFLAAAGVAFFALLSLIPSFAALIAIYGLFADPADVAREVSDLFGSDAGPGRAWLLDQLTRLTTASSGSLQLAALVAIAVALWSASSGVRHLLDAVDMAFGRPRVSWVRARARGLVGVFGLVVVAALVVGLLALAPDLPAWISWLRYPLVVAIVLLGCALLYRRGGATGPAPPGAIVATATWVLGSAGLGLYIARGPDLEAAYGAFASVVV